jgi:predicted nucleotidyltransferase
VAQGRARVERRRSPGPADTLNAVPPIDRVEAPLAGALRDTRGIISAYVFGSVAKGRVHRESDLDVGVLLDWTVHPRGADRFEIRLDLAGRLRAPIGRPVDVVILNDAPPHLARHIMTEGRRLVVTDAEQDHAHLRVVLSRAADLQPFLRRTRAVKLARLAP